MVAHRHKAADNIVIELTCRLRTIRSARPRFPAVIKTGPNARLAQTHPITGNRSCHSGFSVPHQFTATVE
jgi:hypothetical protein